MPKCISSLSKRHLRRKVQNNVTAVLEGIRSSATCSANNTRKIDQADSSLPDTGHNSHQSTFDESLEADGEFNNSEYDSEVPDDENSEESDLLCDKLKLWSNNHLITQAATSDLLKILKHHQCFKDLPADARTLKATRRKFELKQVEPGQYVHLGIASGIKAILIKFAKLQLPESVQLLVNIDGIPVSKSSKSELWPILCYIRNIKISPQPYAAGIYHGPGKPKDHNLFLQEFVNEAKELIASGLLIDGKLIRVEIFGFICDAPACAFITCTKYHSGFSACRKCRQVGVRYENRTVFACVSDQPRKDEDFLLCNDLDDHYRGTTILNELSIGLVSRIPYEFMHLICLGVTRKLMTLWTSGKPKYLKFSGKVINEISRSLVKQQSYISSDFNRRPRPLDELPRWKATEYRLFVQYLGPVILQGHIPKEYYEHFLALHIAVVIFSDDNLISKYGDCAHVQLTYFVKHFAALYGKENLSYNIHGLLHVYEDVKVFGNLNSYSGFCFENYLGQLKNLVQGGNRPLAQICRRLSERDPKLQQRGQQQQTPSDSASSSVNLKLVNFKDTVLKPNERDCYCRLKSGELVKITGLTISSCGSGQVVLLGKECKNLTQFYTKPCDSREFGVVTFSTFGPEKIWNFEEVEQKYLVLERDTNQFVGFPLHF